MKSKKAETGENQEWLVAIWLIIFVFIVCSLGIWAFFKFVAHR